LNQVIFGKAWYYCKKIWDLLVWKNLQRGWRCITNLWPTGFQIFPIHLIFPR
jgi:hypothetical protein